MPRTHSSAATQTSCAADTEIIILNPSDGSTVGQVRIASAGEVAAAVDAATNAGTAWAAVAPSERGNLLRECGRLLAAHAQELADLNHAETGRPTNQALEGVMAGVSTLEQYAQLGPVHRGRSLCGEPLATDYAVHVPRGVVAALTPWNDPVAVACSILGAALVSGNTVVHKPSERCPHLGEKLGEVLSDALPAGVLTTLTGGPDTGAQLAADPRVAVIAHVGSSETGAALVRTAGGTGAHTILENGGNDPLLVDSDVDPVWAAGQAATGAFTNSGQICTAVERIYVHRDIAAAFLTELDEQARKINDDSRLGPLVDERLRQRVNTQVGRAVAAGAHCAVGGEVPETPGTHFPATVLHGCTDAMEVMSEETFGPVAPVQVVESFAAGLVLAAAGGYGLAATVLTGRLAHVQQAVAGLDVGTVKINNVFGGAPGGSAQPRRASGHGFGYGPELLDEMTTVKVVHVEPPDEATGQEPPPEPKRAAPANSKPFNNGTQATGASHAN